MEIVHNINGEACSCNFEWVVKFGELTIFGAATKAECELYISRLVD